MNFHSYFHINFRFYDGLKWRCFFKVVAKSHVIVKVRKPNLFVSTKVTHLDASLSGFASNKIDTLMLEILYANRLEEQKRYK